MQDDNNRIILTRTIILTILNTLISHRIYLLITIYQPTLSFQKAKSFAKIVPLKHLFFAPAPVLHLFSKGVNHFCVVFMFPIPEGWRHVQQVVYRCEQFEGIIGVVVPEQDFGLLADSCKRTNCLNACRRQL